MLEFIDPEDDDANEIFASIIRRRITVVDVLLHYPKVHLTVQNNEGVLALHRVQYREPECAIIVSRLIENGAEVSAWDSRK